MTEKRFTIKHYESQDWVYDNGTYIDTRMMVELLNELHEENEDTITKKEDAEYELLHLKEMYEELLEEINSLRKENMRLKELME